MEEIIIHFDNETGVETWVSPSGVTFEHATRPKNPAFFAEFTIKQSRYRLRFIRTRRIIPAYPDRIASHERVFDNVLLQLEQGIKRDGKWENVRITFPPDDLRVILSLIDGLKEAKDVFDESHTRVASRG